MSGLVSLSLTSHSSGIRQCSSQARGGVVGLPQVSVEDGRAVAEALALLEAGMDFADALHVASSREASRFATFDARLKKRADTAVPGRHVREA